MSLRANVFNVVWNDKNFGNYFSLINILYYFPPLVCIIFVIGYSKLKVLIISPIINVEINLFRGILVMKNGFGEGFLSFDVMKVKMLNTRPLL